MKNKKTCFVIMGFGTKRIPNTYYKVNLDDTYNYLIKPVLIKNNLISVYSDGINKRAYRCDEVVTTEAIDVTFIRNIYMADIVIADITTLNQNAIYELGLRHAMMPKSTIIICDKKTLEYNKFFDLTFIPQLYYDSKKQKDYEEIERIDLILSKIIQACINSDDSYVDSPVFRLGLYDNTQQLLSFSQDKKYESLMNTINKGKELIEREKYNEAEEIFLEIIEKQNYIDNEIISMFLLASYKKELSLTNLKVSLEKANRYINIDNSTYEDLLGIAASIHLKIFAINNDKNEYYKALDLYRKGSNYESGNIYCCRNYCSTLLKIYMVENDIEILKEYYYAAVHNAKVFLTYAQSLNRESDLFNDSWFISNQSDLLLISNNILHSPFKINYYTQRQENTIKKGREELINDLNQLKMKIGVNI